MRLNKIRRKKREDLILEMTPLIDVVFLLLIFFLVATSFEDNKSGIKIDVPTSSIRELKEVKEIRVTVDKNKDIKITYKDKGVEQIQSVKMGELKKELMEKLKNAHEKNVLISADKNLDYGLVIEVMTIVKESGASSLDMDTTPISR